MNCNCKDSNRKCGEFDSETSKDEKLKHLEKCKKGFQESIEKIDEVIAKL